MLFGTVMVLPDQRNISVDMLMCNNLNGSFSPVRHSSTVP